MKRQNGAALLIALMVVVLAITAGLLSAYNNHNSQVERDKITDAALAKAKVALIAWAVTNKNFPGQLPCPEDLTLIGTQNEGSAQSSCTSSTPQIGRLPWKTLGLGDLRDSDGERLWYVLSPGFRTTLINSDTAGALMVDGISNAAVALIIAPGPPLTGQNRSNATPSATDYLDATNATGPDFVSTRSPLMNDRLILVTSDQWARPVERRVAMETLQALNDYFGTNHYYPFPANFSDASCLCTASSGTNPTCKSDSVGCNNTATSCSANVCRGRIPANLAPIDWDNLSILRGTTGNPPDKPSSSTPDWFHKNGWRELVYYAVAPACAEGTSNCSGAGYLQTVHPDANSVRIIVLTTGRVIGGQTRAMSSEKLSEANYLEGQNGNLLSPSFSMTIDDPAINDRIVTQP